MTQNLMRESNGQATARREDESFLTPPASVSENADGYLLEIEMPGVSKDGLEISVENSELSIVGRRAQASVPGRLIHRESRPHHYRRTFEIDPSIDHGKIVARMNQGIVTLTLPKAEEVKPRRITVS